MKTPIACLPVILAPCLVFGQTPGTLSSQRWNNLPQNGSVMTLAKDGISTRQADSSTFIQGAQWGGDLADRYGIRLRGTITAPVTGNYTFFVSGDDGHELWLSPDSSRFNKKRIARSLLWTNLGQWDKYPSQRSHMVRLAGGHAYYLEALMQEWGGGDHLSIGWSYESPGLSEAIGVGTPVTQTWSEQDGAISLSVEAGDIWDAADRFGFYQREWTGDGDLVARVPAMNNPHVWAKVGVMIRASNDPGSAHAMMVRTSANGMAFQRRRTTDGPSYHTAGSSVREWVKLARRGDSITAFTSSDGQDWVQVGSDTLACLPQTVRVGIAASDCSATSTSPVMATVTGFEARPFTASGLISASQLTSLAPDPADADDDGLPDEWETANGVSPATGLGKHGQYGDLDNDGITNFDEFVLGSNPASKDALPDGLTCERWLNISGNRVTDLTLNRTRFLSQPDERTHVAGIDSNNTGDNFAGRYRGFVTAPVSGGYTFWIAGDDEAELWIADGSVRKEFGNQSVSLTNRYGKQRIAHVQDARFGANFTADEDFDRYAPQRSRTVTLAAGESYYIEVLHKEGGGVDHVAVAWQPPGGIRSIIPPSAFISDIPEDDDLDDDNLPDAWEMQYGLNPADNGITEARDGQYGDWDGDGLTNLEEYQLGTDPKNSDTDGDTMSDKDERDYYHSDPLVSNLLATTLHDSLSLTDFSGSSVPWETRSDGSILAHERCGWTEWQFTIQPGEEGVYEARLTGGAEGGSVRSEEKLPISFHLDGEMLARQTMRCLAGGNTTIRQMTPWLDAGVHRLRVQNHNTRADCKLRVNSITIHRLGGADADSNGIADWVELRLQNENLLTRIPAQSRTSPVCIEGMTSSLAALAISRCVVGSSAEAQTILENVNDGFFSNISLAPDAATNLSVSFQRGARIEAHDIVWTPTNILAESTFVLRKGDALRLTAHDPGAEPEGTFTLSHNGNPVLAEGGMPNHASAQPVVIRFDLSGPHTLTATWTPAEGSPQTSTLTVTACEADFGPDFAIQSYNRRTWTLSGVNGMNIEANDNIAWNETTTAGAAARSFVVDVYETGTSHVIARLPDSGDIVARGTIQAFSVAAVGETSDAQIVEIRPDGSQVYRFTIVEENLPPNAEIRLRTYFQGAIFSNGSRDLVLRPSDFSSNGIADVLIEWGDATPHRICHTVRTYLVD